MVYKIVWTVKALQTYVKNMLYLETAWTPKEVKDFALIVEKKLTTLTKQPVSVLREIKSSKISGILYYIKEFH
jgi:hypothetical protein